MAFQGRRFKFYTKRLGEGRKSPFVANRGSSNLNFEVGDLGLLCVVKSGSSEGLMSGRGRERAEGRSSGTAGERKNGEANGRIVSVLNGEGASVVVVVSKQEEDSLSDALTAEVAMVGSVDLDIVGAREEGRGDLVDGRGGVLRQQEGDDTGPLFSSVEWPSGLILEAELLDVVTSEMRIFLDLVARKRGVTVRALHDVVQRDVEILQGFASRILDLYGHDELLATARRLRRHGERRIHAKRHASDVGTGRWRSQWVSCLVIDVSVVGGSDVSTCNNRSLHSSSASVGGLTSGDCSGRGGRWARRNHRFVLRDGDGVSSLVVMGRTMIQTVMIHSVSAASLGMAVSLVSGVVRGVDRRRSGIVEVVVMMHAVRTVLSTRLLHALLVVALSASRRVLIVREGIFFVQNFDHLWRVAHSGECLVFVHFSGTQGLDRCSDRVSRWERCGRQYVTAGGKCRRSGRRDRGHGRGGSIWAVHGGSSWCIDGRSQHLAREDDAAHSKVETRRTSGFALVPDLTRM